MSRKLGIVMMGVLAAFFLLMAVLFAALVGLVSTKFIATVFFSMLGLIVLFFGYLSIVGIVFIAHQMSRGKKRGDE